MNNLPSSVTLYELFRIVIPGAFLVFNIDWLLRFCPNSPKETFQILDAQLPIGYILLTIVLGVFVHSIDIQKLFACFLHALPTEQLKVKYPAEQPKEIEKRYFNFYDELDGGLKSKNEKYNGLFHLAMNLFLVSGLVTILAFGIVFFNCKILPLFLSNLSVALLSMFSSIMIYHFRLKDVYNRITDMFVEKKNTEIQEEYNKKSGLFHFQAKMTVGFRS